MRVYAIQSLLVMLFFGGGFAVWAYEGLANAVPVLWVAVILTYAVIVVDRAFRDTPVMLPWIVGLPLLAGLWAICGWVIYTEGFTGVGIVGLIMSLAMTLAIGVGHRWMERAEAR